MLKRNKGFTLVELLVVIGIIALLVSMLLPALGKARAAAQVTKCAAAMRDISFAVHMYANENKDALPPFRWDGGAANFDLWGTKNGDGVVGLWTYKNQSSTTAWSDTKEDGNGLGRLVKTGYIKVSDATNATGAVDRRLSCTNAPLAGDDNQWRSLYYFNPHVAKRTVGGVQVNQLWFKKLSKFGKVSSGPMNAAIESAPWNNPSLNMPAFKRALMTDPMYDLGSSTHARGKMRTWNLMFSDGSVQSVTVNDKAVRDGAGNSKWQRLLDQSNYLAHVASGGAMLDNTGAPAWNTVYNARPIDPQ